jgi:hypothetical protein
MHFVPAEGERWVVPVGRLLIVDYEGNQGNTRRLEHRRLNIV